MESLAAGLVLVAGWVWCGGFFPKVRFVSEVIELTVDPEVIRMVGTYWYSNHWPVRVTQGLSVPFPAGNGLGRPEKAVVEVLRPGSSSKLVPLVWVGGRPHFQISIAGNGTEVVRVRYTQPYRPPDARYLLTTTRPWNRPLENGSYSLRLNRMELEGSNYELRAERPGVYTFERSKFMPVEDWIVRVRPASHPVEEM